MILFHQLNLLFGKTETCIYIFINIVDSVIDNFKVTVMYLLNVTCSVLYTTVFSAYCTYHEKLQKLMKLLVLNKKNVYHLIKNVTGYPFFTRFIIFL